ncbi:MAG: DUF4149 domain-containing protein, partial [Campylobacterales bacterium]|nr:DUF4149 domain-containing protein [Campylobacterales bacterium]
FTLGAFAAPVIFNADRLGMDVLLGHYNSGIIMAEIFRRFSYWIYFIAFFVLAYETYWYKMGQRDAIAFGASITVIFTSLMFSAVYTPKIIAMQMLGEEATKSDTFENIHIASEIDFKFLAVALVVLFIRRLMLLRLR